MSMKGPLSVIDWQPAQHALCLSPSESWDGLLMLYCRSRQVDGWTLSLMPTIFLIFGNHGTMIFIVCSLYLYYFQALKPQSHLHSELQQTIFVWKNKAGKRNGKLQIFLGVTVGGLQHNTAS